uniref:Uncharacterized protein n=1 Tax=Tetranychus urticae TaxID=32264 RepID=T1L2Z3_TETUR
MVIIIKYSSLSIIDAVQEFTFTFVLL